MTRPENRFEEWTFQLTSGSTIDEALEAVLSRYDAPGSDRTSFLRVNQILAQHIPEVAASYELENLPKIGIWKTAAKDVRRSYRRKLTSGELLDFQDAVQQHDEEMSAVFSAVEKVVALEGSTDLEVALEDSTLGQTEIWGELGHPLLEAGIIITARKTGGIWNRTKEVEGVYFKDPATGKSLRFEVDSVETLPPPAPFESAGKSRIKAEGHELDCYLPGFYEGSMPRVGILRPALPCAEQQVAIPLNGLTR